MPSAQSAKGAADATERYTNGGVGKNERPGSAWLQIGFYFTHGRANASGGSGPRRATKTKKHPRTHWPAPKKKDPRAEQQRGKHPKHKTSRPCGRGPPRHKQLSIM